MLKLSNKERYAVQALLDMAFHEDGAPTQIKDIADRQRIPIRFLEQIFQDLKKSGLVESKRGPRGGYQLARPAKLICVGDVVRATSGPIAIHGPGRRSRKTKSATRELRDLADVLFRDLAQSVERCFDAITLEDVCVRGEELGLPRKSRTTSSYVI